MSKTVVVSKKQFESLGKVVRGEGIWTVDTSAITNLDGRGTVQTPADHAASEKGKGMIEWLIGTALVALGVLATFILFAPRFIEAFNAQITAMIP